MYDKNRTIRSLIILLRISTFVNMAANNTQSCNIAQYTVVKRKASL